MRPSKLLTTSATLLPCPLQTHGRLWLHLLSTSVDCLLMAQLVLLAILISREDHYEWVALLPLIGGTFLFGFIMDKNYSSAFRTIPRDVAEAADAAGPAVDEDNRLPFPFPEAFMPPCMYDDTVLDPDKLLHLAAYGVLGLLAGLAYGDRWRKPSSGAVWLFTLLAAWGILDELTQPLFGRLADVSDLICDILGNGIGLAAGIFASRWLSRPGLP